MTQSWLRRAFSGCLMVLTSYHAPAQQQAMSTVIPFDAKVTTGKLANGLHYYIRPNSKPDKKVELRLVVNAGSILENDNQQGLAHFMEHMNFNGTRNYPKNELVDFLQSIGVQFGADLNAYTSFDETVYMLSIPTDKAGNVGKGFQVLSDWAQGALLTDKDINEERKVVLEESRMGKGADDRMKKIYLPKLLAGSRYADRLPIGQDEILKSFKPEVIRAFYKDWYRPDLMAIAVVGDISVPEAKALIEKYFNGLKNPAAERPRQLFGMPGFKAEEAMVLTDKEATNNEFSLVYAARKQAQEVTLGDYRSSIVRGLFMQILNHRLQDLTQSAAPPYIYSYGYIDGWARGYESFQVSAVASGSLETAINATVGELLKAEQFGFTAPELEIAKKRLGTGIEKAYNERNTTESGRIIGEYIRHFLEQEPVPGVENEYRYYQELMPGITLAEVNADAKKWLSGKKNFFTLSTGPDNAATPKLSNDALMQLVKKAFQQKVSANAAKEIASSLLDTKPVPGKITAQQKDTLLGTTTYTLSNGVKVTVKPTDFKSDEIILSGVKKGGQNNYGPGDRSNFTFIAPVIRSMGYGKFTPTDLSDFLSGKVLSVRTSMGQVTDAVDASSSTKDLETMLQLLYLQLTQPRADEALFKGYIVSMKSSLEFITANPQAAFFDTLNKVFYKNDPRAAVSLPSAADLDKIDMSRVLSMYRDEFGNADGFHFFIVGNVDEQKLLPLLEQYIAALPVKGTVPTFKDNGLRPLAGNNTLNCYKGTEPKSMISARYYGEIAYSEDLDLKADLMADILNIRIIEELREKIGGIYSGGMGASLSRYPYSRYVVYLSLPCGPESVDTLIKAAGAEIAGICKNGPAAKDLAKVKMAQLESYKENMKKNSFWASSLTSILFWNDDKDRLLHFEHYLNNVTGAEIQATANRLFDGKNSFRAVLYPEAGAK